MIADPSGQDPRLQQSGIEEGDVRPIVRSPRAGLPPAVWIGMAIIAGLLLFGVLDARRRSAAAPAVTLPMSDRAASTAPSPLYIPPPPPAAEFYPQTEPASSVSPPVRQNVDQPQIARGAYAPAPRYYDPAERQDAYLPPPMAPELAPLPTTRSATSGDSEDRSGVASGPTGSGAAPNRVRATIVANRATTVLQGTLIPAVLETGFDSSRPGYARALVQRDIKGFDGNRILIPRGSRLIGEYGSDAGPAQKRAMIAWARLVRPDGVSIAIGSPASDPVGRGGVRASVNSHFFERFSGAILQSTLDIGVNLASRSVNSPVVVALPGSLQGATSSVTSARDIAPTLTVRPGTSISVFVARDLDFTDVEQRP